MNTLALINQWRKEGPDMITLRPVNSQLGLINTPLQRGEVGRWGGENRFNGFPAGAETVETVSVAGETVCTPLKRGVNENSRLGTHHSHGMAGSGLFALALALLIARLAPAQSFTFSTFAGYAGNGSADGTGASALFSGPQAVAVDAAGNIYVADSGNNTIRVVTPAGVSSTLAGSPGVAGSRDGTGSGALFNQPAGIALDAATNVYVADYGNHTIRQVTPAGVVTTIAGSPGVSGSVNATGTSALFFHPLGLAVDSAANIYVADYGNHLIRKITPARVVSTLAGSAGVFGYTNGTGTVAVFYGPEAVAVDQAGNVYVADTGNAALRKITPGGAVSALAGTPGSLGSADGTGSNALFFQPVGIAINSATNLYVADYFNNTIRTVTPNGTVTTVAGLPGIAGSTDGANTAARFSGPQGLAVNAAGTVYIADTGNSLIRAMTPAGAVSTVAGSPSGGSADGPTSIARFCSPRSIAIDNSGNIYVADAQNSTIRKVTLGGAVSILAGSAGVFGSADGQGTNALFSGPQGIALDTSGNLYVADTGNSTIRKVTQTGLVTPVAGNAGNPGSAEGSGTNAQFYAPQGLALDNAGRIYVADTWNHTVRKIGSAGAVTTLAGSAGVFGSADGTASSASFNCPVGIAVNSSGTIFVTDYNNHTIRQVTSAGVVSTLAGWAGIWGSADGQNSAALFFAPAGIAVFNSTTLYVADSGNHTLRQVSPSGANWVVTTLAGLAGASGSSDGTYGPGGSVRFYHPFGITANSLGNLFIADLGNNTLRTTEGVAVLTWTNPPAITYGTALGAAQLNATASVPGTFAYAPAAGSVLDTGSSPLSVFFTPTDTVNYRGAGATVSLLVSPAALTVTANNARRYVNLPNPPFSGTITGLQNNDNITANYSCSATPASPAGPYPIVPSLVDPANRQTNYLVTLVNGTLTVVGAPVFQSVAWSSNSFIFSWSATSNQMYQIQVNTNLATTNWVNLGAPVTATNTLATASDTNSAPYKFYRLLLYP